MLEPVLGRECGSSKTFGKKPFKRDMESTAPQWHNGAARS
jgi:hypothetical protein